MDNTPALRKLRDLRVEHTEVRHGPVGSVAEVAAVHGVGVRDLVKTIAVRRGIGDYVFILVPGSRELSWPRLRTLLGVSRLSTPDVAEARQAAGYKQGTVTPFGTSHLWPVFVGPSILGRHISMGGRVHGVGVNLRADDTITVLGAAVADLVIP